MFWSFAISRVRDSESINNQVEITMRYGNRNYLAHSRISGFSLSEMTLKAIVKAIIPAHLSAHVISLSSVLLLKPFAEIFGTQYLYFS